MICGFKEEKKQRKSKLNKSAQSEDKSENEKKNTHCNREKDTNSKWHTIEISTVLLPSENKEAVVLPLLRYR